MMTMTNYDLDLELLSEEKHLSLGQILDVFNDYWLNRPSNSNNHNFCVRMYEKYEAELSTRWEYHPEQWLWKDRFVRVEVDASIPKLEATPTAESGLYLIGDTACNPFTDEHFYYIKVGQAQDFQKRNRQYKTHSATIWRIDYLPLPIEVLNDKEYDYQRALMIYYRGKQVDNTEWFEVDRDTYLKLCAEGFGGLEIT